MSLDLRLLVWAVALTLVQALIPAAGASLQVGLPRLAGNREAMPPMEGWVGRAQRAHRNMLENLILFAALVLVAHVGGKANVFTAIGAQLFFWARLVYAFVYIAGIPWVRTAVWAVSIVGLVMIFVQIMG